MRSRSNESPWWVVLLQFWVHSKIVHGLWHPCRIDAILVWGTHWLKFIVHPALFTSPLVSLSVSLFESTTCNVEEAVLNNFTSMEMKINGIMAVCLKLCNFIRSWKLDVCEEDKINQKHILPFYYEQIHLSDLQNESEKAVSGCPVTEDSTADGLPSQRTCEMLTHFCRNLSSIHAVISGRLYPVMSPSAQRRLWPPGSAWRNGVSGKPGNLVANTEVIAKHLWYGFEILPRYQQCWPCCFRKNTDY